MALKAGIVGLPNVGKSTLFNAITKQNILAANYPFATVEPNIGVVIVPDSRLEFLKNLYTPESLVPTAFEFTDIAGLVKGASQGEGLGNKFLAHIREVDAIVEVVRSFDDPSITHVIGKTDPIRDMEIINVELIIADLEIIENRLEKIIKKAETTKDKEALLEVEALKKSKKALEKSIPLRLVEYTEEEKLSLKAFNFITLKPLVYVANVEEESLINGENVYTKNIHLHAEKENSGVVIMSAKLEAELADLNENEKKKFLNELGIIYSGMDRLIFETYNLLGLQTFFTAGPKEVKAWTFKKGMTAKECAEIIHSDIAKGFIRAEVTSFSDLEIYGSEKKVREAGKLRLEGKEYLMRDGDICYFRFNI